MDNERRANIQINCDIIAIIKIIDQLNTMTIMESIINRLPISRIKLFLASILYRFIHLLLREDSQIIIRNHVKYQVDLSEGIDLSLYVFGNFQKHVTENKYISIKPDGTIFDIGANAGVMALQFAKQVPHGKVYAFEPTYYAFSKLAKNLELNPELAKIIIPIQSFVSSTTKTKHSLIAYASWKVDRHIPYHRHQVHGGIRKSASDIPSVSIDDFCSQYNINKVDLIKIDTDGNELNVLKGAKATINKFKPLIIFELGLYFLKENKILFEDYLKLLYLLGYNLYNSKNQRIITAENYQQVIPRKGTIDILAIPLE